MGELEICNACGGFIMGTVVELSDGISCVGCYNKSIERICRNCKWWKSFSNNITQCENKTVLKFTAQVNPMFGNYTMCFEPFGNFGCNQWEHNKRINANR